MNQPAAKRFSLQRLLTSPAPGPQLPASEAAPALLPEQTPAGSGTPEPTPAASLESPVAALAPIPSLRDLGAPLKAVRQGVSSPLPESHPKKKRSYSVDMKLCEDLEVLSWYQGRSSSSVVEELVRKHLQHNKMLVAKAKEIRSSR